MNSKELKNKSSIRPILGSDDQRASTNKSFRPSRDVERKRVLDLLRNQDPVNGIYAMYGAHYRDTRCNPKT